MAETILGAAGLDAPNTMQGRDIADLYLPNRKSKSPWRTEYYYVFPKIDGLIPASSALVRKEWKFIDWTDRKYTQLFNLFKDPLEMKDLAREPEYAKIVAEMTARLDELSHDAMAPNIPGTRCDSLLPAGTNYSKYPDCSPFRPNLCCSSVNL